MTSIPDFEDPVLVHKFVCVARSAEHWVGRPVTADDVNDMDLAEDFFVNGPALVMHEHEDDGQRFVLATQAGLDAFAMKWGELVGMLSTRSADSDPVQQSARNILLKKAEILGCVEYDVVRQDKDGSPFKMNGHLFRVMDAAQDNFVIGQAAMFEYKALERL